MPCWSPDTSLYPHSSRSYSAYLAYPYTGKHPDQGCPKDQLTVKFRTIAFKALVVVSRAMLVFAASSRLGQAHQINISAAWIGPEHRESLSFTAYHHPPALYICFPNPIHTKKDDS